MNIIRPIYTFLLLAVVLSLSSCDGLTSKERSLPYLGPKRPAPDKEGDTLYHKIPSYSLTDEQGKTFSTADVEGKVRVVDFFFTSCPTICPKLTRNLKRLQEKLEKEGLLDEVVLLSHTVDPEYDTAEVLMAYAKEHGADLAHWEFLTGEKDKIHELGKENYFLTAMEDSTAPGGFLHSGKFVLVDPQGHIRGYYDGTKKQVVNELLADIRVLIEE